MHPVRRAHRTLVAFTSAVMIVSGLLPVGTASVVRADSTAQTLPFTQAWTDISLITANDDWSGVPGIEGFLGQDITTATGTDPQTLLGVSASLTDIDVIANQTNTGIANGGVAEFHLTNPVVALNGSGTADAPYLLINVNTTGHNDVRVSYSLRDVDATADNAIQQVALQYRIGSTGNFTNLPDGYVADATAGPSATMETPISVLLPPDAYNQPSVQVRIITTNAVGNDEWVGVDDISIVPNAADGAPTVGATSPVNGAGGVALDANVSITFDEPVNVSGAWVTISCTPSGSHTAAVSGGPTTFTLDPDVDFASLDLCTVTIESTLVTDADLLDPPNFMAADFVFSFTTLDASVCGDAATLVHDIQGGGATSPLAGQVHTVEGIVVGDYQGTGEFSGYHLQEEDADADADALTSEGIFVFNTAFAVSLGDRVRIRGTVSEFVSSGQSLTQIGSLQSRLSCSSGNTVTATVVNLPVAAVTDWERYEGMRISIDQELTVTETFTLGRFGEVALSVGGRLDNPTAVVEPGAAAIALQDLNNRSRILLDDANNQQNIDPTRYPEGGLSASNTLRIGDTLGEPLVGVLEQRFGLYRVQPIDPVGDPLSWNDTNPRPAAPDPVGGNLRISAMNVLNYFTTLGTVSACGPQNLPCRGANTPAELDRQRDKIVQALIGLDADVVGLMEIENDTGAATENLVNALNTALGGPVYEYIDTGFIGTDAIKLAIIYRPDSVAPVGAHKILDSTIDPDFVDTRNRPALAQTFERTADGARLTVVVNHLKSKSASGLDATCGPIGPNPNPDCDQGDGPGFWNDTRARAAQALVDWIATDPTGSGDPDHLVIGDLNAYAKEDPIDAFVNAGYTDMIAAFEDERYSFVFQGQSGYLDHALASPTLAAQITGATEWHVNADEPIVLDYNTEFKSLNHINTLYAATPYRSSDHDPLVVGIDLQLRPLYLHNNPTPPTGNTRMQHPLPMDGDTPTATTLFNYDRDRDSRAGRLIQKGGSATTTDRTKFQNWQTQTFGSDVQITGDVSFVFWSAMKDFKTDKRGHVTAFLMQGSTVCARESLNPTANWQGGSNTWVEKTITFEDVDCTIPEGSFLQLLVVVGENSADDMWFAYDTAGFKSRLILP